MRERGFFTDGLLQLSERNLETSVAQLQFINRIKEEPRFFLRLLQPGGEGIFFLRGKYHLYLVIVKLLQWQEKREFTPLS